MYTQRLYSASWKVRMLLLHLLITTGKKALHVNVPFLIDVQWYQILKPRIRNSWVRHKQLSVSENSDSNVANQISDINLEILPKV